MKITFVGSGHGVPAAERYCSSAMIEAGGAIYFIDAGAPIMDELLRLGKSINDVRSVFITHCHSDHTLGLLSMAGLLNWYYKEASVFFYLPEEEMIEACKHIMAANHNTYSKVDQVKYRFFDADFVYEDENIKLTAFKTRHIERLNAPSYGFVVTDKESGKRIVFTGDLSHQLALEDFPAVALSEDVDALVCEMAHFKLEHVAPYLERCTAKAVYFNHVFPLSKLDDIEAANGSYPFPLYTLKDRDEIVL